MDRSWAPARSRLIAAASLLGLLACSRPGPRDVGNSNPRSEFGGAGGGLPEADGGDAGTAGRVIATPTARGKAPIVLFRATTRALVTSPSQIYFGDEEDDVLYVGAKSGGQPAKVARRAPTAGALAIDRTTADWADLVWIASPGDTVLRTTRDGSAPTVVRDRGLFTDVAIAGGDVFLTEADAGGGHLTRVTGATAARLASFDGSPRGVAVDAENVYVTTTKHLVATPRTRGPVTTLATAAGLGQPVSADDAIYATTAAANATRILARFPKRGGPPVTIATQVRDAPIALHGGVLYWFDARRPALLAVSFGRGDPVTISEDPVFERPEALAVDADGAFVATGRGESATIVRIPP